MEPKATLAAIVRGVRRCRGLSQHDLDQLDLSYLGQVERGEVSVTIDILDRLAAGLGVEPATLLLLQLSIGLGSTKEGLERVTAQLNDLQEAGAFDHIALAATASKLPPGRPLSMGADAKISAARRLRAEGVPVMKIARDIGLSEATVRRYLKKNL